MYVEERENSEGNDFQYGLCDILHFPNMLVAYTHTLTHTHTLLWRGWVYVPHNPLNLGRSLWQFWPTDNGANDILWLSRLGCQENATPGPWEPSLGAVRKLKLPHLEGPTPLGGTKETNWVSPVDIQHQRPDMWVNEPLESPSTQLLVWDPQDCGAALGCSWNSDPQNLRAW